MANYKTHKNLGIAVTMGLTLSLAANSEFLKIIPYSNILMNQLNLLTLSLMIIVGIAGSLFPDVDLNLSIPTKVFKTIVYVVSFSGTMILLFLIKPFLLNTVLLDINFNETQFLMVAMVIGFIVGFIFIYIFKNSTIHRGLIHSIPFAIVSGMTVYIFLDVVTHSFPIVVMNKFVIATMWSIGFITHLILDEAYSVNFRGHKILKKSFGTALKLYDKNNVKGTIVLYCLIVCFYYFYFVK